MQETHNPKHSCPDIVSAQTEQDGAQLVKASQQGDQNAFALLVQRYQRRVFTMSLRMLQDGEEAKAITQETFLAAWRGLPSLRGEALFPPWLYRITYHCCLRQLEQRKREKLRAESEELHDWQAVVCEQLERLPPKYRIVLILRHLQEMTYEECCLHADHSGI